MELSAALLAQRGRTDCALVDCLTIWLSNLLLQRDAEFAEEKVEELVETLPRLDFHVVLVTNEVGWGIVPDNALARQFRDLAGWANQRIAAAADEVVLTVAGIPMIVKKSDSMSLDETLKQIRPLDRCSEARAQQRLDSLTKPQGSLGRLEELARRIAVIQGKVPPRLGRKLLFIFAADHGITEEGVSAYPKDVTAQMTYNFLKGGAAINVLARHYGVDTEVVDVGVDYEFAAPGGLRNYKIRRGTANFARGPAMTRDEAVRSVELGIELVREAAAENIFLLGAGDMGIGNTSSATAILCALTGARAGRRCRARHRNRRRNTGAKSRRNRKRPRYQPPRRQ